MRLLKTAVSAAFVVIAGAVHPDTLYGTVIAVTDGDTIKLLDAKLETHVIRMFGIDAPEKGQPFGLQSKQALSYICFGQKATVETHGHDRYGRTIGDVTCRSRFANAEQVRNGMAWVYVKYAPRDSALYAEEKLARGMQAGLWNDERPTPPWEWRKGHRN